MNTIKPILKPYITQISKHLPVLDIGCGKGTDAHLLAQQGFTVEAIDKQTTTIQRLQQQTPITSLTIHTTDIRSFPLTKTYGAIICLNMLHFITPQDRANLLNKVKAATVPQGFHFISAFTTQGDLHSQKLHFFNKDELRNHYADWIIHTYTKAIRTTREKDAEGNPKKHEVAFLVAQKPA